MKGISLKLRRVRARLRQDEVARAARCSRARIGQLELLASVPDQWAVRYLRAIKDASAKHPAGTTGIVTAPRSGTSRASGGNGASRRG
jgi:hypothetical protein